MGTRPYLVTKQGKVSTCQEVTYRYGKKQRDKCQFYLTVNTMTPKTDDTYYNDISICTFKKTPVYESKENPSKDSYINNLVDHCKLKNSLSV